MLNSKLQIWKANVLHKMRLTDQSEHDSLIDLQMSSPNPLTDNEAEELLQDMDSYWIECDV